MLKLFAWRDRGNGNSGQDATDFARLLTQYYRAGNTARVHEESGIQQVHEANEYDVDLTAAWLLGADAARVSSIDSIQAALSILDKEKQFERLVDTMAQSSRASMTFERMTALVTLFRDGLAETAPATHS